MSAPVLFHEESGWIKHNGGDRPIHPDCMVRFQFRCGKISEKDYRAGNWIWRKRGWDFDIAAYLITQGVKEDDGAWNAVSGGY